MFHLQLILLIPAFHINSYTFSIVCQLVISGAARGRAWLHQTRFLSPPVQLLHPPGHSPSLLPLQVLLRQSLPCLLLDINHPNLSIGSSERSQGALETLDQADVPVQRWL